VHNIQVLCQYRLCRADHVYLTYLMLQRQLSHSKSKSHCDWRLVSQSWCRAPSGAHDQIFIAFWQLRSCFCGAPSLTRRRVCFLFMLQTIASATFFGSESLGTWTIFYCLRFETSLFVAYYDSQGHGGGIRPRLHTGSAAMMYMPSLIKHWFSHSKVDGRGEDLQHGGRITLLSFFFQNKESTLLNRISFRIRLN
jgi:hypothetical protein